MSESVVIPKGDFGAPAPCWIPIVSGGIASRPLIKCQCGHISGIGLHHVHSDGRVTASFFHDVAPHPDIGYPGGGCGWHVFLTLQDWSGGEFPPTS